MANEQMKEQMRLLIESNRTLKKEMVKREKEAREVPSPEVTKRKGLFGKVTDSFNDVADAAREKSGSIFSAPRRDTRTGSSSAAAQPFIVVVPKAPGSPPPGPSRPKKLQSIGESVNDEEKKLKADNDDIKSQIKHLIDENRAMKKEIVKSGSGGNVVNGSGGSGEGDDQV